MKQSLLRLSILTLLLTIKMAAFSFEVDGIYYSETSSSTVEVVQKNGYSGDIVIPENVEYKGKIYSVTSIHSYAFMGCSSLTSVTIPNSVTSIGSQTFQDCSSLTSVTIPNGVNDIGYETFRGCSGLTSVTIPNSVKSISTRAFSGCKGLTSITIGKSVTSISKDAFEGCSSLTSVTILCPSVYSWFSGMGFIKEVVLGNNVTSIGDNAFSDCSSLTSITIPNSVKSIGYKAFLRCYGLTSVLIGNSVTSIGGMAFRDCRKLTSVTIPNSVISIGEMAFRDCYGLTSLTIGNSVTSIGINAFGGCSGLTSLTIPNNVTSIGQSAFYGCTGMTSLTIGNSVISFGSDSFGGCSGLISVFYDSKLYRSYVFRGSENLRETTLGENVEEVDIEDNLHYLRCLSKTPPKLSGRVDEYVDTLEVPYGYSTKYAKDDNWNKIPLIFSVNNKTRYYPVIITSIGGNIVSVNNDNDGCEAKKGELVEIKANSSLANNPLIMFGTQNVSNSLIKNGYCKCMVSEYHSENTINSFDFPLTSVTLSESGTLIDKINLDDILNIENLKIAGNINGTDLLVIRKMENLKLLDLGEAHIVNGGMSYYKNYTTSENKIGDYFFDNNRELYRIILPNDITEIKYGALTFCNRMKAITIPPSVVKISDTFYAHDDLSIQISDLSAWCKISFTSVIIGVDVYQFRKGHALFLNDKKIVDLVIPDGITSINDYSFFNVAGLRSITIPKSVVSIGKGALWSKVSDCIISLNPTPPEILSSTLYAQEGTTLYVPKGSKTLYWLHPYWEKFKNIVELEESGINDVKLDVPQMSKGVYTIDGVKVSANADNIESLPKGIYIVNGEKVILK